MITTRAPDGANKCNQGDYASSYSSSLRFHLKAHSGERSNKCNQCDFASFQAIKTIKTVEQNCDPLIHLSYVDDLKILAKELNSEIKRAFDCSGGIR